MKDQNQLQHQLSKLKQIAPSPIDLSFTLGYLAFAIPLQSAKQLRTLASQLIMMLEDGLISSTNVLQILTVIKFKVFGRNSQDFTKDLRSNIQTFMNQLAVDSTYLQLKYFQQQVQKQEPVGSQLEIQCPICLIKITGLQLCCLNCGHMYHRHCLNAHCRQKILNKVIPIPCPHEDCKIEILLQEITQFLDHQLRNKYEQFGFHKYVELHMEDTSWCPTPGCSAVFTFDEQLTEYACPTCKNKYCLRCKCEFHTEFTCEEYKEVAKLSENDKKFMFLVKGAKYKQCPNCKFWVEKNQGCDHMTCRCKYQFCYICGGKYNRCKCKGFPNQQEQVNLNESILINPNEDISYSRMQRQIQQSENSYRGLNFEGIRPRWEQQRPVISQNQVEQRQLRRHVGMGRQRQRKEDIQRLKRQQDQLRTNMRQEAEIQRQNRMRQIEKRRDGRIADLNQLKSELKMKMDSQIQKIRKLNDQYRKIEIERKQRINQQPKEARNIKIQSQNLVRPEERQQQKLNYKPRRLKEQVQTLQNQKLQFKIPLLNFLQRKQKTESKPLNFAKPKLESPQNVRINTHQFRFKDYKGPFEQEKNEIREQQRMEKGKI